MQHYYAKVDTPSFRQFNASLDKSREVNSTCAQSLIDNFLNQTEDDEIFIQSSIETINEKEERRHSSYQVQRPSLHFNRYSLRDNVKEKSGNFEKIEHILKDENLNLKNQNEFLLKEVMKLKASNKYYKTLRFNQDLQMKKMEEELDLQLTRTQEMRKIMTQLIELQHKLEKIDHQRNPISTSALLTPSQTHPQ